MIDIKKGDRFQVVDPDPNVKIIYTVTDVVIGKYSLSPIVIWECEGRKVWMKRVSIGCFDDWLESGRLIRI